MWRFKKNKTAWLLLLVGFIFVIFRLPSLTEPHWYGDEGIYQVVGRAILQGRVLYQEIWDNKPPMLYLLYALVSGNLYAIKLLSLISGLLSVFAFYLLSGKLFTHPKTRYVSVFIYTVLFSAPILEGNIANAENFMLLPVILAAYYTLCYRETRKVGQLIVAGLLLSFAVIIKIVAIFDFSAFLTFLLLAGYAERERFKIKPYFYYLLSITPLFVLCVVYFFLNGALVDFMGAVFVQNVSYVGEENAFIFPMGTLIFKTVFLSLSILAIALYSKKISIATLFIYLWTVFGFYNAFFSDRPYTHYLLVLLPAFSLLCGLLLEYRKKRVVTIILISVILFFAYNRFQIYRKTISYYQNYIAFMTGVKDIVSYENFFDSNTPRDYDIANFIDMNVMRHEEVFLWSDSAQIYALSNKLPISKYIVAYHIKFYENADIITKEEIENAKPKFIIQTAEGPLVNDILSSYELRYIMKGAKIYERQN